MTSVNTESIINHDAAAGEPYAVALIDGVNAAHGERAALAWQTRDAVPAIIELHTPHAGGDIESRAFASDADAAEYVGLFEPWQGIEYGDTARECAYSDDGEPLAYDVTSAWMANALYIDLVHDYDRDGDRIKIRGTTLDDEPGAVCWIDDDASDDDIAATALDLIWHLADHGDIAQDAAWLVRNVIDRRGAWGEWRAIQIYARP